MIRLGIVVDKLYAAFAFMDLQPIYNYNPNIRTYVAMYDAPFGRRNFALSQRVLDNMLGSNYDIFPWFRYLAVNLYAWATNSNLINGAHLKDRIAIRRFESKAQFVEIFGDRHTTMRLARIIPLNSSSTKVNNTYTPFGRPLASRCRQVSQSSELPVRKITMMLSTVAPVEAWIIGLKILLSYYEYYNNFAGF